MFSANRIIGILKNPKLKSLKANTIPAIKQELSNVFEDSKNIILNRTVEESCKYVLWQGILNDYGIFGCNRDDGRILHEIVYYNQSYKYGDLLSIDFGTTNIGSEFAFTHTGLVLKDFGCFVIVIPITSYKDTDPDWLTDDLKKIMPSILKKDCPIIRDDSYVLLHQIKSVSKNRITKKIGNMSEYEIMKEIEGMVSKQLAPNIITEKDNEIKRLKEQLVTCGFEDYNSN